MAYYYPLLAALILPVLILIFTRHLFKSRFFTKRTNLPPGPTPWPILGNIPHMMGSMPHVALTNLAKLYGPLISLRLGTQLVIVGSSPDVAREFYKNQDRIFCGRHVPVAMPSTKDELNQSSIGWAEECTDGWKHLRTTCKTELFSNQALQSQAPTAEKNINELINFLRDKEGEVMNIAEPVFATVFNILGSAMVSSNFIGLSENIKDGGVKAVIRKGLEEAGVPNLADFYPILSKLDLQGMRKSAIQYQLRMETLIWGPITEERRRTKANSSGDQDFLDILLHNDFTNKQISQIFVELFSGGTDSTTSTVEWAMAELIRNPECMTRLKAELESEIKQDFPKNFHLMQIPYLGACIKETLRLHPPGPLAIPHRAIETCKVMNYTIPKNSQVLVNIWAIGRDPSVWEQPLEFKPERFLNADMDFKGNNFEFLPFGGGRRICPGLPMAARNIPLIMVSLIRFFDWELPYGKDPSEINMNEKYGFSMCMEQPLSLLLKARM